jgi:thiamine kinase-like enzyme
MSPRELAARALGIDVHEVVSVDEIKHGLTNESWLVRTASDAVVVRLSNRHWASLQIDRIAEALVLDVVGRAGIGPEVVASDVSRGVLVTRYLGPTGAPEQMTAPTLIERLGKTYRALHGMRPPDGIREVHLPTVIAGYLDTLDTLHLQIDAMEPHLRARAMALATEIAASSTPTLCHNDVHHLNLVDREPLRLIDWEYAGLGEPYFDLASVCVYHDYSMQHRVLLLQAYAGAADPAHVERLSKCCWLFEYIRELWTCVQAGMENE